MKKAFDKTLDSISILQDSIDYINTEKTISNEQKLKDLDEINEHLKQAQDIIVKALAVFRKYEKDL